MLFIAPIPPPISGHSLASHVLLKDIEKRNKIFLINLSKDVNNSRRFKGVNRVFTVISFYYKIYKWNSKSDIIYFTISESFLGNLKDIFIYCMCFKKLSKMTLHLHGGSFKSKILDKYYLLRKINEFFISKVKCVIILGNSHRAIFSNFVDNGRIKVLPNFAENLFNLERKEIEGKFKNIDRLKILFLTNLLPLKGYMELLNFYINLDNETKQNVEVHFAGRFDSDELRKEFIFRYAPHQNIHYHGVVQNSEKKELLKSSHILCLPTKYLEGQPISILEAYASGCVVMTTNNGGIPDIFRDSINGFLINDSSPEGISLTFKKVKENFKELKTIAINNNEFYRNNFTVNHYLNSCKNIIKY